MFLQRLLLFFVLLWTVNLACAHPGRTDSSGGHTNRRTGGYHSHNSGISPSQSSTVYSARTSYKTEARTTYRTAPPVIPSSRSKALDNTSQSKKKYAPKLRPYAAKKTKRDYRIWHSNVGTKIKASLIRVVGDTAGLEDEKGREIEVKRNQLTPPDQAYIKKQFRR
jgi:hypothetical protein